MSERTDDPSFGYSWTRDVDDTLGPINSGTEPGQLPPDAPIIRAPLEGEGGDTSRMPYNPYMTTPFVQALSDVGKGIVRGVGLQVHPSLDYDTPIEATVSGLTQAWHPGLDVPKAAIMATKALSGNTLQPEEQRALVEGVSGRSAPYASTPIPALWNNLNMASKIIGTGKALLGD